MNQTAFIQAGKLGNWHIRKGSTSVSGFTELRWAISWCNALNVEYIVLDKEGNELTA